MDFNVTYIEMIQITLEAMGAAFSFICLFTLLTYEKTKIIITIRKMVGLNALVQISDSCAYLFRGETDSFSMVMTRISNYLVFFIQLILLLEFGILTFELLAEYGVAVKKRLMVIIKSVFLTATVLVTVNLFTGIVYYFDENNYYQRNTGWYFYALFALVILTTCFIPMAANRKKIDKGLAAGMLVCFLVPIFSVCFQTVFYGISLISIAVTVSIVAILYAYTKTIGKKNLKPGNESRSRSQMGAIFMFFLMFVTMGTSVVYNINGIQKIAANLSRENTNTVFFKVKNSIENEFFQPIAISDALAQNVTLKKLMDPKITPVTEDVTEEVVSILASMQKAFGYTMLFAAGDSTRNYYTYENLSRTMDCENDPDDSWYLEFINSGLERELNVDTDKDNGMSLSVFVNRRIKSEDGRTLGVCGVGIDMTSICEVISRLEEENNVRISFADESGLVMLSSDIENIETKYLEGFAISDKTGESVENSISETGITLSAYIANMGWYLVMENRVQSRVDIGNMVFTCILLSVVGIFLMAVVFWIMFTRERNVSSELEITRTISYTDRLTGIGNRRAYDQEIFRICDSSQAENYILVNMDVNGLKTANDTFGHDAGDELLCGASDCISSFWGKNGKVFRTGGDEFAAILKCNRESMPALVDKFESVTKNWTGNKVSELTISLGWVYSGDYPDASIDELERKADELMYQDKAKFYAASGRDRRRH